MVQVASGGWVGDCLLPWWTKLGTEMERAQTRQELERRSPLRDVPLGLRCKAVVLAAVRRNGDDLQHAPYDCLVDREVLLAAVEHNGLALRHALDEERGDEEIVLAAVRSHGDAIQYAPPPLAARRDVVLAAAGSPRGTYAHFPFWAGADQEVAAAFVANKAPSALEEVALEFLTDPAVLKSAFCNKTTLSCCDVDFPATRCLDDVELLKAMARSSRHGAMRMATEACLQANIDFAARAFGRYYQHSDDLPTSLFLRRDFVEKIVTRNSLGLRSAPAFADDEAIARRAVRVHPSAFVDCSERLRHDSTFFQWFLEVAHMHHEKRRWATGRAVREAVRATPRAVLLAPETWATTRAAATLLCCSWDMLPEELLQDDAFLRKALAVDMAIADAVRHSRVPAHAKLRVMMEKLGIRVRAGVICEDGAVLRALRAGKNLLANASPALRDDEATIYLAIEHGVGIQFASARLRDDAAVVRAAVARDWRNLEWASTRLRSDEAVVRCAMAQDVRAIMLVADIDGAWARGCVADALRHDGTLMAKLRNLFGGDPARALAAGVAGFDETSYGLQEDPAHLRKLLETFDATHLERSFREVFYGKATLCVAQFLKALLTHLPVAEARPTVETLLRRFPGAYYLSATAGRVKQLHRDPEFAKIALEGGGCALNWVLSHQCSRPELVLAAARHPNTRLADVRDNREAVLELATTVQRLPRGYQAARLMARKDFRRATQYHDDRAVVLAWAAALATPCQKPFLLPASAPLANELEVVLVQGCYTCLPDVAREIARLEALKDFARVEVLAGHLVKLHQMCEGTPRRKRVAEHAKAIFDAVYAPDAPVVQDSARSLKRTYEAAFT